MTDSENKRMIGTYEVIHAVSAGSVEIVMGYDLAAEPGERYMCTCLTGTGFLQVDKDTMVSDDYAEILRLFSHRIAEQAERMHEEQARLKEKGVDDSLIQKTGYIPITYEDDLKDKIVVIKPEVLKPESQRATKQYQLCIGGFGASPHSRGSACFCTNLFSGKTSRFERMDVMGIVPSELMPDWAKAALERIELQRNTDREAR